MQLFAPAIASLAGLGWVVSPWVAHIPTKNVGMFAPPASGASKNYLINLWRTRFANVKKRIIFYSAFAGYVIGFFARTTFNPGLEYLTPAQGCLLGAGPYWNAVLMVAPQNCILYGMIATFIALLVRLLKPA
jgi:hypothetical protein